MSRRFYSNPLLHEEKEDNNSDELSPDNAPGSPSSGEDDSKLPPTPSPKKSKRSMQKRVVSVPIGDVEGSRNKAGDVYPPSDSWAWRKYGQKPIKGSPYPRGYYRCSSSKGCPARKQVERSRVDPTKLVITYASDHNHPVPMSKSHQSSSATSTSVLTSSAAAAPLTRAKSENDGKDNNLTMFTNQPELGLGDDPMLGGNSGEFGWLADVASDPVFDSPICAVNGFYADGDVTVGLALGEEEESLFADLGELPECSLVFRGTFPEPIRCCCSTR